ncbi:MAG TPA: GH25 family lysozyme [Verrucomicrobiae bacterium]|nr:GH25 family lysozyme [Verrucomicrobiae bacterium]
MFHSDWRVLISCALLSILTSPALAQLVSDGGSASVSGTTAAISGNLTVGTNGSFTTLTILNGGDVTNTGAGVIGQNSLANNNQVIVRDSGSRWGNGGTLSIGSLGSFNRLTVTNGGRVVDTFGNVALNGGSGNTVLVTGPNSVWTNTSSVNIGNSGTSNQLIVTNGGVVSANFRVAVGNGGGSNLLLLGSGGQIFCGQGVLSGSVNSSGNRAIVWGTGSQWNIDGELDVGASGSFNTLMVTNGGGIASIGAFVGANAIQSGGGNNNLIFLSGPGASWTNFNGNSAVGDFGSYNTLVISNGAVMFNTGGTHSIGFQNGSTNNTLLVTGTNSLFAAQGNPSFMEAGLNGSQNLFSIRDGGRAETVFTAIGSSTTASNNMALVSDPGSVWTNSSIIQVGLSGSGNHLSINNSGLLLTAGLDVGFNPGSDGSVVSVQGGNLMVTNVSGTATTEIRRGLLGVGAGLFQTDTLLMTNPGAIFTMAGGTSRVARATTALTAPTTIGAFGVAGDGGVLELIGNNTHAWPGGLVVGNLAMLTGNGTITGTLTNEALGTLSPGFGIGKLMVNGQVALLAQSTNVFEINRSATTNDSLMVSGALQYGGTLIVSNLAGNLASGDSFKLFNAATYSGAFSTIILPPLDPPLFWTDRLSVDGTIAVAAPVARELGVDVSHFQGENGISASSWVQMANEGKRFAFIKATEGLNVVDGAMAANMDAAESAGIRAGVYHFAHPDTEPTTAGAIQEADYFLSFAGNYIGPGHLRPVLDLELAGSLSQTALTDWVLAFANEIVARRGPAASPIIYTVVSFANNLLDGRMAGHDLWVRSISTGDPATNAPPPSDSGASGVFGNWSFWQYSGGGVVRGIAPVDLDVCHSEYKPLDSFLIPAVTNPVAPSIISQPQSRTVLAGTAAIFGVSVSVASSTPLSYVWRLNGTNIPGALQSTYIRPNCQLADAGAYSVVVSNGGGAVTSLVATLMVAPPPAFQPVALYAENFDEYATPSVVSSVGSTNGFKIFYNAATGPLDFTARFGFDYGSGTSPLAIPSAPNSTNSTTKGLSLTVNKDGTPGVAAVNLYPLSQVFTGSYSFKFDLWINHANNSSSTEHALFGLNHSGNVTNRPTLATSDGLFFAMDGDGGGSAGSGTVRDFSVYQGGGSGVAPILKTDPRSFGPEPVLGANFDNVDPGFRYLFPPKTLPGSTTTAGSPGLGWLRVELRQLTNQVTWLINDYVVAQYTNTSIYQNGNIMIGYADAFSSVGSSVNYAIFDNLRVETAVPDYDNNGLTDAWEMQYFGHLGVDPAADADGDGASNLQEMLAGTDPRSAASRFRILEAARTNNDFVITWSAVGGHSYTVQFAPPNALISGGFTNLSSVISVPGTNEVQASYVDAGAATNPGGYYRVKLAP